MLFDFLESNLTAISTVFISIVVSIIPTLISIKDLTRKLNDRPKAKIEITGDGEKFAKSNFSKDQLETIINYAINTNKDGNEGQSGFKSTPPVPQPPNQDFKAKYLSKIVALNELYDKRNTDKALKKISFMLAVIMSVAGTVILFVGILLSLFTKKEVGWITTSSGAIIELIAGIYFWLVNRTMKEVKDNSKQLEKTEDLLTAIELAEKINDTKIKDETYKNMIDKLLPRNDK